MSRIHQAAQFSSVCYTLERLFLGIHWQKLWMVPIEPLHSVPLGTRFKGENMAKALPYIKIDDASPLPPTEQQ